MKYRAVGFDYGGVLKGEPSGAFLHDLLQFLSITHEEFKDVYYRHNKKVNRGEITWDELWTQFATDIGQPEKAPGIISLFKAAEPKELNLQVLGLADALRQQGFKTGILSNNTREMAEKMREEQLSEHFDVIHVSAETGFVKPEPKAFVHFASALGVKPEELLFIDDSPKSLSTAQEVGFAPIHFTGYSPLITQLHEHGIQSL